MLGQQPTLRHHELGPGAKLGCHHSGRACPTSHQPVVSGIRTNAQIRAQLQLRPLLLAKIYTRQCGWSTAVSFKFQPISPTVLAF